MTPNDRIHLDWWCALELDMDSEDVDAALIRAGLDPAALSGVSVDEAKRAIQRVTYPVVFGPRGVQ